MLPAFRTLLRQKIAEFLSDDAFLDNYFESLTGAQKKQAQTDFVDAKIAAVQTQIDNIDTYAATIKAQELGRLNALKAFLLSFKTFWASTPE